MAHDAIRRHLTAAERGLLLRYGYPFSQSEAALKACAACPDVERVPIDRFNLEQLIGNLCCSINQTKPGPLQDDLLKLCNRFEAAERYGDGELDVIWAMMRPPAILTALGIRRLAGRTLPVTRTAYSVSIGSHTRPTGTGRSQRSIEQRFPGRLRQSSAGL